MNKSAIDLILTGGRFWTENPDQPEAEAIAVSAGRIFRVGASADILALKGTETNVLDLRGRRVLPGFNDAHLHFYYGGTSLTSVQLRTARNREEFRDRIAKFAKSRPKGDWILYGEWDPEGWTPRRLPNHQLIDDVTCDHPVFVNRVDAHTMLANALAMKLAGVDKHTPDVPGGVIERDEEGNPTGIFIDAAKSLIERAIPNPAIEQMAQALLAAQRHAFRFGVTSVQDMGFVGAHEISFSNDLFRAYQYLQTRGELKIRITLQTPLRHWNKLADVGLLTGFGNEVLRVGGLKGFADGSLGSSTAWFLEPYSDNPPNCGGPSDEMVDPKEMLAKLVAADAAGLQLVIHAIGDRANRIVLDSFEQIEQRNGSRDRRFRIEHAQHLQPTDIARFGKLKVVASMQPYHATDDGRWANGRIGEERARGAWAMRSILKAGGILAFGSDWWVAPIDPLTGIYAAVTRRPIDGSHLNGWVPEEKISVKEAIHGYTVGAAYASFQENIKGSLEPGKLADMVILSQDLLAIDPDEIPSVRVDMTIVGGEIVYVRDRTE